jgi:hypothetical protein
LAEVADFSAHRAIQGEIQQPGSNNPGKKEQSMTIRKQFIAVAIFSALACAGLPAQSADLRATIPFNFHAGDRLMPAGEYLVHLQGPVVIVRPEAGPGPASALLTYGIGQSLHAPRNARLDFNCYGSEYFLAAVWDSYSQDGRQIQPTPRQKELAKLGDAPAKAMVALARSK